MSADVTGGSDRCPSGVYLIDAEEREQTLRQGAFPAELNVAVLDGTAAATRAGFFQEIARTLHFPDYFGHNWDAVYDCLTDLTWLPADGYVLVLDGFDRFATDEPEQWAIALKVLREACAFWKPLSGPMLVLLYGPCELAPRVSPSPPHVSHRGAKTDESEVRQSEVGGSFRRQLAISSQLMTIGRFSFSPAIPRLTGLTSSGSGVR